MGAAGSRRSSAAARCRAITPTRTPWGEPGHQQGVFQWPGTGQMYSSARDMAVFLAANLGALPDHRPLQEAMALAQAGMFTVNPRFTQALAWQLVHNGDITFVDKNGGRSKTPTFIGMIPPKRPPTAIFFTSAPGPAPPPRRPTHAA